MTLGELGAAASMLRTDIRRLQDKSRIGPDSGMHKRDALVRETLNYDLTVRVRIIIAHVPRELR